jgi:lysine-ketoglutarate reductase/saccharopine dehydrogenase-like protein (TIGR00300 family)
MFELPAYVPPDFSKNIFQSAPDAPVCAAPADALLPEGFHATTIYPEYFKVNGQWKLIGAPRMDCAVVLREDGPWAVEARNVRAGDSVVVCRSEDGRAGVYVDYQAFERPGGEGPAQPFAFRQGRSRESSYSRDYDLLYEILRYERENGYIVWVLGPAVVFDHDARRAMARIIGHGYAHALFAGNALATHDLEAALYHTGLGQDIYTKEPVPDGHYNHLETINRVREAGSIESLVERRNIGDGVMAACVRGKVPYVLAGSIRDDGPLPEVIGDVYKAQAAMRAHTRRATTVIALATQLHTIATGNMTPAWQKVNGRIRPVYFYTVDISEFAVNKLRDRGSLSVNSIVTNIQDFLVNAERNLVPPKEES